jgi:hypothetical protein
MSEKEKKRKYFEVFGDTINQLNFFKNSTYLLLIIVIFGTIILSRSINKMPLVIRVDALGNTETFKDVKSALNVSPAEVNNFTQYFLQYWTAYNFYTHEDDMARAFNMMTENYTRKGSDYLATNQIVDYIKANQIKTKLIIQEILILKDTKGYINLKVKGTNEIRSYQNPEYFREEIFEYELSFKKVKRSDEMPWGLLVDSWAKSYFKK